MKAISLHQPYATGVVIGAKTVETRGEWALRVVKLVGTELAIHATVSAPARGQELGHYRTASGGGAPTELHQLTPPGPLLRIPSLVAVHPLPLGAVVGTVRVAEVLPMVKWARSHWARREHPCIVVGPSPQDVAKGRTGNRAVIHRMVEGLLYATDLAAEVPWGDYAPDRVGVLLTEPRQLAEPVPCRGWQQVWNLPPEVEEQVLANLAT